MLFERFAKGRVGIISCSQRDLSNVHRAHAQLPPGALHAHTADVAGNILAHAGNENAVEVGHRESSNRRKYVPVERFIDVHVDIPLDAVNTYAVVYTSRCIR